MFPLRDDNPTSRRIWMTWVLVFANVAVFALELYIRAYQGDLAFNTWATRWAFDASLLGAQPLSPYVWVTVFASMFIHGGWVHIGGNMLYLSIFGNNIEDRLGPWRFLAFYLACGVAAALLQAFGSGFAPGLMVGASGAVAGTLGAYLLLFPRNRVLTAIWIFLFIELARVPAWILIAIWFLLQLGSGLASLGPAATAGGVAYLAHVGGFIMGMALIAPAWLSRRRGTRYAGWSR